MLTFTPLSGLSEVVLSFLPEGDLTAPAKFTVFCTWDEVPHLSQEAKDGLWRSIPVFQRDARSKGVPSLGAGAIYPVPDSDIVIPDFEIPPHWPRAYGLDVGWNRTAAVWGALDRDSDVLYLSQTTTRRAGRRSMPERSRRAASGSGVRLIRHPADERRRTGASCCRCTPTWGIERVKLLRSLRRIARGDYQMGARPTNQTGCRNRKDEKAAARSKCEDRGAGGTGGAEDRRPPCQCSPTAW